MGRVLVDLACGSCGAGSEELLYRQDLPPGQNGASRTEWIYKVDGEVAPLPLCACGGARTKCFGRARLHGVSPTTEVRLSDGTTITSNAEMRRWIQENPTARQVHPGTTEDKQIRRALEEATQRRADRQGIGVGAMKERNRRAFERRHNEGKGR